MMINLQIDKLIKTLETVKNMSADISKLSDEIYSTLKQGGKILVMGNGGSAADAQHLAAEFVGRFQTERPPLAAIALSCNTSTLTSVANDFSFDDIFARQIEALAKPKDIVIAISTSGNSANIIAAVKKAKEKDCFTAGLLGAGGGKLKGLVDLPLTIESDETPRIQECHIFICHTLCSLVEGRIAKEN